MSAEARTIQINYEVEKEKISQFLTKFTAVVAEDDLMDTQSSQQSQNDNPAPGSKVVKYVKALEAVSERKATSIVVELDDIASFEGSEEGLVQSIEHNTSRYVDLFSDVIDTLLPSNYSQPPIDCNPLDMIIFQRRQRDINANENNVPTFPKALTRSHVLNFKPRSKQKARSIRDVTGSATGRLVTIKAIVTRVSDVKPQILVMAFSCDRCGSENFQQFTGQLTTPVSECQSEQCKKSQSKGKLYLQTRATKTIRFQEAKLQELTDQVPMGHIPRSMTAHLKEDLTRQVKPGDLVIVSGVVLPVPYSGFKAIRAGLLTDTFLDVQSITHIKKQYSQMELTKEIGDKIRELFEIPDLYEYLAKSIAPEIYGHDDIKKALLLLLVGGANHENTDGMKIRGDLNICLMGDPGVAKSQLLKHISKIAPRGVYTTGRGSSGVGLTASVTKDPVTDEMVLEGGALVLADNGIACIDEFDKMDENDRTAIHEVMEQQTISISKAGISTTLNARASILAAANPLLGRYNPSKGIMENINLPAALLSRFDLLFLILDKPDLEDDLRLASHVAYVHKHNRHQPLSNSMSYIDSNVIRHYISMARTYNPQILPDTAEKLVKTYTHLREYDGKRRHHTQSNGDFQYTSARSLLSMIRLSTALARLRFSESVEIRDVEEALRLTEVSKSSVVEKDAPIHEDPSSAIFKIIRELSKESNLNGQLSQDMDMAAIRTRVSVAGFSEDDLEKCIQLYESSNLWMRVQNGRTLTWLHIE